MIYFICDNDYQVMKAAAYAVSQAGTWLFPFWGTANMDSFVTGDYPRAEDMEGSNEWSWVL